MSQRKDAGPSGRHLGTIAVLVAIALLALSACTSSSDSNDADDKASGSDADATAELPAAATDIMAKTPYAASHWSYLVVDPTDGSVIYSNLADEFVFTASITKNFTVGTAFDVLGPDTKLTTPVYATTAPVGGTLTGDLVLVAQGDLALGGRGAEQGKFNFTPDGVDHVYADAIPGAKLPTDDPLAGLDSLAEQVAASGVTTVNGDVLIDTRIWETYDAQEGPVPPIFVNDNLLDIQAVPGQPGAAATVETSPPTAAFTIDAQVTTGEDGSASTLSVEVDESDPRLLHVTGSVPPGDPTLTVFRIEDAATWARFLFIEALGRAGVTVTAPLGVPNDDDALPSADSYSDDREVASIESAPISEMGGMVLATSYNTGANTLLCLLAVNGGSNECDDGLEPIRDLATKAEIDPANLVLVDGQGGNPASATPEAMVQWLEFVLEQPWGPLFEAGLPVLGERGSLGLSGQDSPAKGKVKAKTGTTAAGEPLTGRLFMSFQGLAGYLDVGRDQPLVFMVGASNAVFSDMQGIFEIGDDVAGVAAAIQQDQEGK